MQCWHDRIYRFVQDFLHLFCLVLIRTAVPPEEGQYSKYTNRQRGLIEKVVPNDFVCFGCLQTLRHFHFNAATAFIFRYRRIKWLQKCIKFQNRFHWQKVYKLYQCARKKFSHFSFLISIIFARFSKTHNTEYIVWITLDHPLPYT